MPKISVIIPTHNRPCLLKKAIESVRAQTFVNWELLVVDDGDAGSAECVVKEFHDDRIKYLKTLSPSSGGGVARNMGVGFASGEYVAFLDDDDCWLPQKLSRQLSTMQSDKSLSFSYHAVCNIYNDRKENTTVSADPNEDLYLAALRGRKFLTVTLMIKTEALRAIGLFNDRLASNQESEMMIRLAKKYKGIGINKVLTEVNMLSNYEHVGSSVQRKIRGLEDTVNLHLNEYVNQPKIYAKRLFDLSLLYRQIKQYDSARKMAFKAFGLSHNFRYAGHYFIPNVVLSILKNKLLKKMLPLIFGFLILFLLWQKHGLNLLTVAGHFSNLNLVVLFLAITVSWTGHLLAARRWQYVLGLLDAKLTYKKILSAYVEGLPYSKILSGVGEAGRGMILRNRTNLNNIIIFKSILIEVVSDVLSILFGIALVASFYWLRLWPILILLLCFFLGLVFIKLFTTKRIKSQRFFAVITEIGYYNLFKLLIFSLVLHSITALSASLIVFSFIRNVNPAIIFARQFLTLGASFLPITFAGVGTRDVLMLGLYGDCAELVLSSALMIAVVSIFLPALVGVFWQLKRFLFK
jgi:glycosyltransferase involved in cell wall biosynthesis